MGDGVYEVLREFNTPSEKHTHSVRGGVRLKSHVRHVTFVDKASVIPRRHLTARRRDIAKEDSGDGLEHRLVNT